MLITNQGIQWQDGVNSSKSTIHPIIVATTLFSKLIKLKPFNYENEKIAKLALNLELLKSSYPIVVIEKKSKSEFDKAVVSANYLDDITPLSEIITSLLLKSMKMYIKTVK